MTGLGTSSHTFCLAYVCSPIYFNWQLGFFQHVCRACSSPENLQYSGYCQHDAFIYSCFQKDYLHKVHNVLSSSQRLLRQARAPHRCIKPEWLLISKLLNPRPANLKPGRSGPNYCLPSPRRAINLCCNASFL